MDASDQSNSKGSASLEDLEHGVSSCTINSHCDSDVCDVDGKSSPQRVKEPKGLFDPEIVDAAENDNESDSEKDAAVEYDSDEEKRLEEEKNMTEDEKEDKKTKAFEFKMKGNELFKSENYRDALIAYKDALHICPIHVSNERAVLYSNRAACFQHLKENDDAIVSCTKALDLNPAYVKARARRASLYETTDKLDEALQDYKTILEYDPAHREAQTAARELPYRINERNEKLKTEMLGKLKDLGNLVLKPFGLSTDNFQVQQDPNTGGYSVNFQQGEK